MGKPFKIREQGDPRANISRGQDGKFARLADPPGKVHEEAKSTGETVTDVVRANRVPPHPINVQPDKSTGDAVHKQELPWPDVGESYNDAGRPPMKLREG